MSHFAIIIGVNDYADPAWRLSAAVDDALAFLDWALGPGGVPKENVRLLLSSAPERELPIPCRPADSRNILKVIEEFQTGLGAQGERLYFYYAGHGAAAPGARDELVLIPADVESLQTDYPRLIGFSQIIPALQHAGPAAQLFFIDACRDLALEGFTRGAAPVVGRWRGPAAEETPQRRAQYLLYATSPGERALEAAGSGVFGRILLEGLKGDPGALVWCSGVPPRYELRFSQLAEHVRSQVEDRVKELGGPWRRFVQLPEQDIPPGPSGPKDVVLASFDPEQVPPVLLRIRVQPPPVRQTCGIEVRYYLPGGRAHLVDSAQPKPPAPLPFPVEFRLPPGDYTLQAQATGFRAAHEPCALYRPQSVDLMLQPVAGALDPLLIPFMDPEMPPEVLIVDAEDPHALIVCLDPDRQEHSGVGRVSLENPRAGIYRARLVLPEGAAREVPIEVSLYGLAFTTLHAPPPQMGEVQQAMLRALELLTDSSGYTFLSDELGPVAQLRLASLLGFAAFQAWIRAASIERPLVERNPLLAARESRVTYLPRRQTRLSRFEEPLDRLGIQPRGNSGLLVLLGASGDRPSQDASVSEFFRQSRLELYRYSAGELLQVGTFEELSGFGAAAQWRMAVSPGPYILELSLPHLAPTRYALTVLREHLSILVVVADDSGEVEVQQYLAPLPGLEHEYTGPAPLDMEGLRHVELGQRYLASGTAVPPHHLQPLFQREYLDPLLGCIAGYALVREGRQESYRSSVARDVAGSTAWSPMREMLRYFGDLPDVHVLAGLCEPEHQQAHFERALERGLPLFADGLRALQRCTGSTAHPWFAEASGGLLPSSLWTAWVKR